MKGLFHDIRTYCVSVVWLWCSLVTGGLMAGFWLCDEVFLYPLPHFLKPAVAILFLIVAPFLHWREEQKAKATTETKLSEALATIDTLCETRPLTAPEKRDRVDILIANGAAYYQAVIGSEGRMCRDYCKEWLDEVHRFGRQYLTVAQNAAIDKRNPPAITKLGVERQLVWTSDEAALDVAGKLTGLREIRNSIAD